MCMLAHEDQAIFKNKSYLKSDFHFRVQFESKLIWTLT